ncbi:hypothetical protein KFE25_013427 [Diacronema lutheri]|uniref:SGNH hydrolase-type esterase domain-containing protein n=2 Tax=Diacronema lutheri TaxID=2081491 RepID=A0A8J5XQD7_DIALT|nr:hypothetical protein KFE25_013427 [Diacronema lutheri]
MAVAFGLGGVMAFALSRARARRAARGQVFSRRGASWSTAPARIVCFGDSITEYGSAPDGWVARLGWAYSRKADVVNRGLSGYTSRLVRAILAELLAPLGPLPCERTAAVTLMLGSNDATEPGGFQHVPPDEFLAHMVAILRALRAAFPAATLLVLSPPPVDGAAWDAHCRRAYGAGGDGRSLELAREYGALAHRAAVATGCLFVDVLSSMIGPRADAHFAHLLSDGLHLSAAGHAHVYNLTQLALRDTAAAPDALREHFPRDPVGAPQLLLPCRR